MDEKEGKRVRNLKKDLKTCEKATKGPWEFGCDWEDNFAIKMAEARGDEHPEGIEPQHEIVMDICGLDGDQLKEATANMKFIAASRNGWPYALKLLQEVAHAIQECRLNNGGVFLGTELEKKINQF